MNRLIEFTRVEDGKDAGPIAINPAWVRGLVAVDNETILHCGTGDGHGWAYRVRESYEVVRAALDAAR